MCLFGSSRTAFTLCGSQEPFSLSSLTAPSKWCGPGQHVKYTIGKKLHKELRNRPAVLRQDSQKLPQDTSSYITSLTRKSGKCSLNSEDPYAQLSIEFSWESKAISGISRELFPSHWQRSNRFLTHLCKDTSYWLFSCDSDLCVALLCLPQSHRQTWEDGLAWTCSCSGFHLQAVASQY